MSFLSHSVERLHVAATAMLSSQTSQSKILICFFSLTFIKPCGNKTQLRGEDLDNCNNKSEVEETVTHLEHHENHIF